MPVLANTRFNLFPNARCVSTGDTTKFMSRFGWVRTFGTGDVNTPRGTYARWQCVGAQTGPSRGVDLFGNMDLTTPPGGGLRVVPGEPLSLMAGMRSSQAVAMTARVRYSNEAGATPFWVNTFEAGDAVTMSYVPSRWVQVSSVVPAGATHAYFQLLSSSWAWVSIDTIDLTCVLIETTTSPGPYFDGSGTYDKLGVPSWLGVPDASVSMLIDPYAGVRLTNGTATVGVLEILSAPLSRPLRRTVLDVQNDDEYVVNHGTPGKLAGSITYLCDSLSEAQALDALLQGTAPVTLNTRGELDGLKHVAVGDIRYGTEKALPGLPCKWTVQVEIREVT